MAALLKLVPFFYRVFDFRVPLPACLARQDAEEQHKRMSTGQIVSGSPECLAEE
jgi:hypothetical protein